MGITDKLSETFNRGVSETERMLEVGKLKTRIGALAKNRTELLTALGAVVYDQSRKGAIDPAVYEGLVGKLREVDLESAQLQARVGELQSASAEARVPCPCCGQGNPLEALFCTRCGAQLPKKDTGKLCASCGAALPENGRFCVRCGTAVAAPEESQEPPSSQPAAGGEQA